MAASTEKHETRALLRAHLAAAQNYRHRTGSCPVCLRLLRLAIAEQPVEEYAAGYGAEYGLQPAAPGEDGPAVGASGRTEAPDGHETAQDESPPVP